VPTVLIDRGSSNVATAIFSFTEIYLDSGAAYGSQSRWIDGQTGPGEAKESGKWSAAPGSSEAPEILGCAQGLDIMRIREIKFHGFSEAPAPGGGALVRWPAPASADGAVIALKPGGDPDRAGGADVGGATP
jgi:hypothetical protein